MKSQRKRNVVCKMAVASFCFICTGCTSEKTIQKEVPVIRVMAWAAGHTNENKDLDLVNEALSDLTERKIGCRLELMYPSNTMDYRLILGSKKKAENQADIVGMYEETYRSYLEEGYLMKLDSYLEQYGDGIFETLECEAEDLVTEGYDGESGIYAVPKAMPEINIKGIVARTEFLEKYQFSLENVKEIEDMEPFLLQIAKQEEISPIVPTAALGGFFVNAGLDSIDSTGAVVVRIGTDGSKTENFFETPEFEAYIRMMQRWREKGILTDRVGRQDELGINLVVAGKVACAEIIVRPDEVEEWLGIYGDEITIQGFDMKPFMTTRNKWRYNWCVSSECEDPELAVQVLELMYTDPEVNNLMLYGVKDVHYVVDQNGFFSYPEGTNSENVGYFTNEKWQFNRNLGGLWKGMSINQRKNMEAFNNSAVYSPVYGFILDEKPIQEELSQINKLIGESYHTIQAGFGDGETSLLEFQRKIRDAGIEKVQAEVERQILQWKDEKQ